MTEYFRQIGHLAPDDVLAALGYHEPRFGDLTWRQATPGSPHADTETIYLRMPPVIDVNTVFHSLEVRDESLMAEAPFRAAVDRLGDITHSKVARAMIVRLKPHGMIRPHCDEGTYAESTERYHWVITTNPQCRMASGNDIVHMRQGEVWFFDKHAHHFVVNGPTPRIHLIFDVWREGAVCSS